MSSIDPNVERAARAFGAWVRNADHAEYKNLAVRIIAEIWMAGWHAAMDAREDAQPARADHGR